MYLSGCNCVKTITVDKPEPCPDCLQVAAYFTGCENAPEPCGGTATIDVAADSVFNGCSCDTSPDVHWQLVKYDDTVFDNVSISSSGSLEFTINSSATPGEYYTIYFRADCACNNRSDFGHVLVCAKDLCRDVSCTDPQTCDPCTGECS